MSNRKLGNWLESYLEYTEYTESATVFHKWVAISILSAVLQKKVWFRFGRLKVFPNTYVVLVAEPGIARKSQAISYGLKILRKIDKVHTSSDSITREALLQELQEAGTQSDMPGVYDNHCSLSIISKEFESFLGQKSENARMLVLLTDLFDCEEGVFKYRTKNKGTTEVNSPYLSILGATTPESLASSLPPTAIGGGLTSRIMFVWANNKEKKIAIPELDPEVAHLKDKLLIDLSIISRISGEFDYSVDSRKKWIEWYNNYDDKDKNRICKDTAFNSWYSRKPLYILKLAMINSVCESNSKNVDWKHFNSAITQIEDVELAMGQTFSAVGRSEITSDVDLVMKIVKKYGEINERQLMQIVWRDIDSNKFENVIGTLIKSGRVCKDLTQYNSKGVIYKWEG